MIRIKSICASLFFLLCCGSIGAQSLGKGLIAHYAFDKQPASNLEIKDESSNQNTGTYVGNIRYVENRFGVGCRAISFDGASYITIPNSASLSQPTTKFTAAVWVKIADGADFFKEWLTILCKSNSSTESFNSPHYRMHATATTVSLNTDLTKSYTPQLSYDTWYFYAYTYDGSKLKVYINGAILYEEYYQSKLSPNNMPLEIGRDLPGFAEYFNGVMDDLRIYKRALSKSELDQLYQDRSAANQKDACVDNSPVVIDVDTSDNVDTDTDTDTEAVIDISIDDPIYDDLEEPEIEEAEEAVVIVDTAPVLDAPEVLDDLPVEYQDTLIVQSKTLRIYPFDNKKQDGDIVSININGEWVKTNFKLKKKKYRPSKQDYIHVTLKEGDHNYIISKALNVGAIPPNTLTLEIDDGVSKQKVKINSDMGVSGGIKIVCQQNSR
ncbi:MAG: LamG domain-containing protein [Saprospiraceae bacterium]